MAAFTASLPSNSSKSLKSVVFSPSGCLNIGKAIGHAPRPAFFAASMPGFMFFPFAASDGHNIDCKIEGIGAMKLKSEFVKKA